MRVPRFVLGLWKGCFATDVQISLVGRLEQGKVQRLGVLQFINKIKIPCTLDSSCFHPKMLVRGP